MTGPSSTHSMEPVPRCTVLMSDGEHVNDVRGDQEDERIREPRNERAANRRIQLWLREDRKTKRNSRDLTSERAHLREEPPGDIGRALLVPGRRLPKLGLGFGRKPRRPHRPRSRSMRSTASSMSAPGDCPDRARHALCSISSIQAASSRASGGESESMSSSASVARSRSSSSSASWRSFRAVLIPWKVARWRPAGEQESRSPSRQRSALLRLIDWMNGSCSGARPRASGTRPRAAQPARPRAPQGGRGVRDQQRMRHAQAPVRIFRCISMSRLPSRTFP